MNAKPTRKLFTAVALSALAAALSSSADARIPEGNGTVRAYPAVVGETQAAQANRTFFVDPVFASLDPAIRTAIVARAHATALAAKAIGKGKGQHHKKFPAGYRGLP